MLTVEFAKRFLHLHHCRLILSVWARRKSNEDRVCRRPLLGVPRTYVDITWVFEFAALLPPTHTPCPLRVAPLPGRSRSSDWLQSATFPYPNLTRESRDAPPLPAALVPRRTQRRLLCRARQQRPRVSPTSTVTRMNPHQRASSIAAVSFV